MWVTTGELCPPPPEPAWEPAPLVWVTTGAGLEAGAAAAGAPLEEVVTGAEEEE